MDREIYNEYLLIMPSGNCKGFNDVEGVKAYINLYYEKKFDHTLHEDGYNDATEIGGDEPRLNVFTQLGVEEGKCEVYNIQEFIEILENKLIFEEDKEEIISKLSEAKINLNIYEYGLDEILTHIQEINIMDDFGDRVRN